MYRNLLELSKLSSVNYLQYYATGEKFFAHRSVGSNKLSPATMGWGESSKTNKVLLFFVNFS